MVNNKGPEDVRAIEHTHRAMDIFEQLELVIENLKSFGGNLAAPHELELEVYIGRLSGLLISLDTADELPGITTQLGTYQAKSKIERLGFAQDLIKLKYRDNLSNADILKRYAGYFSENALLRFFRLYDSYTPREKAKTYNSTDSVFDTHNQLEKLLTTINTQLSRLTYSNDPKQQENHRAYVAELRQLIKLASDFRKDLESNLQQQQFQKDVTQILLSVCDPIQRERAVHLLRQYQAGGFSPAIDVYIAPIPEALTLPRGEEDFSTCTAGVPRSTCTQVERREECE